jgi:putative DNA methylase
LQHGHISALHLWWPALLPNPDDPDCPKEFREAMTRILKTNVPSILKSYQAKWPPEWLAFEHGDDGAKQPGPSEMRDDRCLVK